MRTVEGDMVACSGGYVAGEQLQAQREDREPRRLAPHQLRHIPKTGSPPPASRARARRRRFFTDRVADSVVIQIAATSSKGPPPAQTRARTIS